MLKTRGGATNLWAEKNIQEIDVDMLIPDEQRGLRRSETATCELLAVVMDRYLRLKEVQGDALVR